MDKEWGKEQVGRDGKWWVHHAEWYDVTCLLCFCFLQENECGKVDEEVKERWETGRKDGVVVVVVVVVWCGLVQVVVHHF